MNATGERCQYCDHDKYRMSDDSARLGIEIRVCQHCNMFFDTPSQENAKTQHINSCFEESFECEDGFGESEYWL